jgi:PAS domain S-box-containing protein
MTSSESIVLMTVFGLGPTFASVAWATPASETCAALGQARTSLYSMLHAKDKSAQDALKAKIQASSTKIDSALASLTGAEAKVAADFKAVWDQFTATRDTEIIPAIDKSNFEDAKKIADGIQFQRLSRMWFFGHSAGQAIGQTLDLIIPEEERADHWRNFRRVMATGMLNYRPDHVLDIDGLRRDGTRVMLDAALIAIFDEAGGLVGITAIIREADRNIIA